MLRGIGLATYIEFSSPGFYPQDEVEIRFCADGTIELFTVTHSSGQSHETTFARIVADVLCIDDNRIRLRTAGVDRGLTGSATGGSRSLFGVGSVLKLAAQAVVDQGRAFAARALEAEPSQVEFSGGVYRLRDAEREISLDRLAITLAHLEPQPLNVRMAHKFGGNYPNGCHVAEVEIAACRGSDGARQPGYAGARLERLATGASAIRKASARLARFER